MKLIPTLRTLKLFLTAQVAVACALAAGVANAQTGPGSGINILANPGFEAGPTAIGWTIYGQASVISTNATYYNGGSGGSNVVAHSGTNTGNAYNSDFSGGSVNYNGMYQSFATVPGSTYWAYGWGYSSPEDLLNATNSFWIELGFYNLNNQLVSLWSSIVYTNAGTAMPDNVWLYFPITNQCQVNNPGTSTAVGTETVISNTGSSGIITAPAGATSVRYQVVVRAQANQGGSVYYDDCYLDKVSGPEPPYITNVTANLNGVTLATNTSVSFTIVSPSGTITNAEIIAATYPLAGVTNTVTNTLTSTNLSVTGLNTASATATYQLQSNLFYTITLVGVDNGGNPASTQLQFDTLRPALVIEASDFNYNGGSYIDTPANGGLGLYAGLVGEQTIDESHGSGSSTKYYRTSDPNVIQPADPSGGSYPEQKFVVAAADGDTNATDITEYELGYNSKGDWADYTRDFGSSPSDSAPAGAYTVWTYLATDGSGINSSFAQVTSSPSQANQTLNVLGNIGTQSFSDNGWNTYKYVPLVDSFGNLVSVTISSGAYTFRSTVVGNPNLGFYMLMPVTPILTPSLQYSYPDGVHPFEYTNKFTATIGPANGAPIEQSGIDVILNGEDVTSKATIASSGSSWTITYPLAYNAVYSGVINVTNTNNLSSSFPLSFDTFNISNYQWEAVDYDFSTNNGTDWIGGLYIDNPIPTGDTTGATGEPETNSYFYYPTDFGPAQDPQGFGAVAQQGIDINFPNDGQNPANEIYRPPDGVGTQAASDYLRPKYVAEQIALGDPNIGPLNLGYYGLGYWLNYTRDYPTNNYYIWGRLAGGAGAFSGTTLSLVTSGVGTTNQTTDVWGTFADPNASGWQAWHWIQMMSNGTPAVVTLHGKATLRVTSGNNLNTEFFMLVPAPSEPNLSAVVSAGQITISIPTQVGYTYQVYYTPSLSPANWHPEGTAITGDGSVHTVTETLSGQQGYYQVR